MFDHVRAHEKKCLLKHSKKGIWNLRYIFILYINASWHEAYTADIIYVICCLNLKWLLNIIILNIDHHSAYSENHIRNILKLLLRTLKVSLTKRKSQKYYLLFCDMFKQLTCKVKKALWRGGYSFPGIGLLLLGSIYGPQSICCRQGYFSYIQMHI